MDEATRLGVTQAVLSVYLSGALSGNKMVSMWENGYNLPTTIYTEGVHDIDYEKIGDMLVPTSLPGVWVPLRQVADIHPRFQHDNLTHRNGRRCITVMADVMPDCGQLEHYAKINEYLSTLNIPEDIVVEEGGSMSATKETMPSLLMSIMAAVVVMFVVLIIHYKDRCLCHIAPFRIRP